MTRNISIFGATGSIGASTFSLLDEMDASHQIEVIAGYQNGEALSRLAHKYRPKLVVAAQGVALDLPDGVACAFGDEALLEAAARPVDWALNAIIGFAGLKVSLQLAQSARILALANKESMVAGGALLKQHCVEFGCQLLPVDSEHGAIFECLMGQDRSALTRVILTASGGPFRNKSLEEMRDVTLEQALAHPVWDMGARITIDSATLFNKALEMIEAKELFDLAPDAVDVIVHPGSIVHSFVEFSDQGLLAQLGCPDMKHAIGFALFYPQRARTNLQRLDLAKLGSLHFEAPDEKRFPALRLAREVMQAGGVAPVALNAAKEVALDRFFAGEIGFLDMAWLVEEVLASGDWHGEGKHLSEIEAADFSARKRAKEIGIQWR